MPWKECHVMDERVRFVAPAAGWGADDDALRRIRNLTESGLRDFYGCKH